MCLDTLSSNPDCVTADFNVYKTSAALGDFCCELDLHAFAAFGSSNPAEAAYIHREGIKRVDFGRFSKNTSNENDSLKPFFLSLEI